MYRGTTHGKGLAQPRGSTSEGVKPRAKGLHPEKGKVDRCPEKYSHVLRAYKPKRAGTATLIHLRRHTAKCLHTEKGLHRHVDQLLEARSHGHRAYTS